MNGLGFPLVDARQYAGVRLDVAEEANAQAVWIYAVVAAFPTLEDGLSLEDLRLDWNGAGRPLAMTETTFNAVMPLLGDQNAAGVRLERAEEIADLLWRDKNLLAIVPFEALDGKLKVLEVNGQSPLRKDFDQAQYPLKTYFVLSPRLAQIPKTNRDETRLTTVLMTGTTALVRAIAYKMQVNGMTYPAREIGGWLRGADILHISNEVAFAPDCPPPDPMSSSLRFCSAEENIGLLEDIGVDVVELTGNHVNDWGPDALAHTIDMYHQRGWKVFGGGLNLGEAGRSVVMERAGVRFAFIGCNEPGPEFAWATDSLAGAMPCGDYAWMVEEIRRLKAEGDIVIVALQNYEYYSPEATPRQKETFRALADAGADIVSGSQAHFSQSMEFYNGAFIHYGLGNLFFDQMFHTYNDGQTTTDIRREFLDRYVFYEGRLVGIELLTTILEDYSRPRPMDEEERRSFLQEYFQASGWGE